MRLQLATPRQKVSLLKVGNAGNGYLASSWTVLRQCLRWHVNERRKGRAEQQGASPKLES